MISAKLFLIDKLEETQTETNRPTTRTQVEEWMIEFAKMHLIESKKEKDYPLTKIK